MLINAIVAMDKNRGIGINNNLPWRLPQDMQRFQKLTKGNGKNAIVMGKNTWNSIRILKDRDHLILSSRLKLDYLHESCNNNASNTNTNSNTNNRFTSNNNSTSNSSLIKSFESITDVINFANDKQYDQLWIIGGSQIYKQFLELNLIDNFYITFIDEVFRCDTYLHSIPNNYILIKNQITAECTNSGKNTYILIYKQLKKGASVIYNHSMWKIENVHCDDYPNYYYTIKNDEGREIQTVKSKLKMKG